MHVCMYVLMYVCAYVVCSQILLMWMEEEEEARKHQVENVSLKFY